MESIFKIVIFIVVVFFSILGIAALFGYNYASSSVDDISNTPCIPVLSNGNDNPHYKNVWYSCKRSCIGRSVNLNVKTCDCSCK